jgi:hypothetical protein
LPKKQLGSWILTFNILAQILVSLSLLWWATNTIKYCTNNYFTQKISHSSIIKGYYGQLIKQSRITVRGGQSIDLWTLAR